MKNVFGPVTSNRLGQSLGIDTIPLKTCNWNCVYCQLGRTTPMTHELREYVPREAVIADLEAALAAHKPGEIDWITFVGSGEPTLHSGIGWLIEQVKARTDLPVAIITNGSLLYLPEIRQALQPLDAVLPSLDAGTPELYRVVNRPHPEATFERLVDGMIAFREEYANQLWVEVMLVAGLNDSEQALKDIAAVLKRIQPDQVHINLPTRPPAETWVKAPEDSLLLAQAILGDVAHVVHPRGSSFHLGDADSLVEAITGIITRHPIREDQLIEALVHWSPGEVDETLSELAESGEAQVVKRYGVRFWSAAGMHYPDDEHSQRTRPDEQRD